MKYFMGIDNGGTFVKAGIVDEDGRILAIAREPVENLKPRPGFVERDMEVLWLQNVKVIRNVLEKSMICPEEIVGISFSGHGKGLYLVGYDGRPSYPGILSTDNRAWEQVQRWKEDGTAEKIFPKTWQEILACQPVSLLAWLKENDIDVLDRTKYIFSVKDYIRFRLTGAANAEYTDFSGANLINLNTCCYDRELLKAFGLEEILPKLPPLVQSHDICGAVSPEAAKATGLAAGTPVTAGMFDVDACGIASGMTDRDTLCMIAGTWSINEYISEKPIADHSIKLNSMFCVPGYFLIEESSPTSAGNLQWFIDNLLCEEKSRLAQQGKSIYTLTNAQVDAISPENQSVYFLPFLNGSNENPMAKGCFIGLTEYHDRAQMIRAIYEGIVFSHMTHVERLLKNRSAPMAVRLAGGVVNSPVWVQMFADCLQMPIETVECTEHGILGAAMAAAVGTGSFESYTESAKRMVRIGKTVYPRKALANVYAERYTCYKKIIEAMDPVWNHLQRA